MPTLEQRMGMTVLELVVAIALLGLLLAIASALLGATSMSATATGRAAVSATEIGIARGVLRRLLVNAEFADHRPVFTGDERRARFFSYCADALDDVRRCAVVVEATADAHAPELEMTHSIPDEVRVRIVGARLAYLHTSDDRRLMPRWQATDRLPDAIAVVHGRDTTWLRLGRP